MRCSPAEAAVHGHESPTLLASAADMMCRPWSFSLAYLSQCLQRLLCFAETAEDPTGLGGLFHDKIKPFEDLEDETCEPATLTAPTTPLENANCLCVHLLFAPIMLSSQVAPALSVSKSFWGQPEDRHGWVRSRERLEEGDRPGD